VIRSSEDVSSARSRLQEIFSLSEEQTEYILELRLRRLTKFSRLELETERDALLEQIAHLTSLLGSESLIRETVSAELAEVSATFGTPRRSVLSGAAPTIARTAAEPSTLEVADAPCEVLVSSSGRIARVSWPEGHVAVAGARSPHDALLTRVSSRLRGSLGAITSLGVLHVFQPMDLPHLPPDAPRLAEGLVLRDYLGLGAADGEIVSVVGLDDGPTILLGTTQGVVKRCSLADLPSKSRHNLIGLKDGDEVVGASLAPDGTQVVLITSQGQLLNFPAESVRPQGLAASGMAGMSVPEGTRVIWASATLRESASVLTFSGSSLVLPGTESVRAKRTPLEEFPAKGRATGGVRAHTLLKGEDQLVRAWVGANPLALSSTGAPLELDLEVSKRDASGVKIDTPPAFIGEALA
jgi:DNA gyrase subunit A